MAEIIYDYVNKNGLFLVHKKTQKLTLEIETIAEFYNESHAVEYVRWKNG